MEVMKSLQGIVAKHQHGRNGNMFVVHPTKEMCDKSQGLVFCLQGLCHDTRKVIEAIRKKFPSVTVDPSADGQSHVVNISGGGAPASARESTPALTRVERRIPIEASGATPMRRKIALVVFAILAVLIAYVVAMVVTMTAEEFPSNQTQM